MAHGFEFFYRDNSHPVFPNHSIEDYFLPVSTVEESAVTPQNRVDYRFEMSTSWERTGFKSQDYTSPGQFRTDLLRSIYRLQPKVLEVIEACPAVKSLSGKRYLAMHVRRGDKTTGPYQEIGLVHLSTYLEACVELREQTGLNLLAVCTDTQAILDEIIALNEDHGFNLFYTEQYRPPNDWQQADVPLVTSGQADPNRIAALYPRVLNDFEIMLRSAALVGDWGSNLAAAASEMRSVGLDVDVSAKRVAVSTQKPVVCMGF